jgi:hypothetical protein
LTFVYNRAVFQTVGRKDEEENRLNLDLQNFEIHLILTLYILNFNFNLPPDRRRGFPEKSK